MSPSGSASPGGGGRVPASNHGGLVLNTRAPRAFLENRIRETSVYNKRKLKPTYSISIIDTFHKYFVYIGYGIFASK